MATVECDPEITVPQSLDDLAVELNLLFLLSDYVSSLLRNDVDRLGALLALARLVLDLGTLGQRLEAVAGDVRVMHEEVLALLREHRSKLDDLALALLDRETLDGPDAYAAAGIEWVLTDEDLRDTAPAPA